MTGFEEAAALAAAAPEVTGAVAGDAFLPGLLAGAGDAYLPGALGSQVAMGSVLADPAMQSMLNPSLLSKLMAGAGNLSLKDALMFNSAMNGLAPQQQPPMAAAPNYRPQQVGPVQFHVPQSFTQRDRRLRGLLGYFGE